MGINPWKHDKYKWAWNKWNLSQIYSTRTYQSLKPVSDEANYRQTSGSEEEFDSVCVPPPACHLAGVIAEDVVHQQTAGNAQKTLMRKMCCVEEAGEGHVYEYYVE